MDSKWKKAWKIASNLLLVLVAVLTILFVGVRVVGIQVLAVLSPSMEPNYPTGALIYLVKVDPAKLEVEDVITYRISEKTTATHRIKEIVADEKDPGIVRLRTKGDNNDECDKSLVEFEQVEGKVIFCIPLLGYLAMYIQRPPGLYVAIGTALAVAFFARTVDAVAEDKRVKNKNELNGGSDSEKI